MGLGTKILKGTGKFIIGSAADAAGAIGNTAIFGAETLGKGVINTVKKNGFKLGAAALTTAAAGAVLADLDGQVNPSDAAKNSALYTTAGIGAAAGIAGLAGSSIGGTVGSGIASGVTAAGVTALGAGMVGVKAAGGLGSMIMDMPKKPISFENVSDIKLNGLGKGLLLGTSIVKGIGEGMTQFEKSRMGTTDGMLRTATPIIPVMSNQSSPSYANNAGATGDLVFSMYKNR